MIKNIGFIGRDLLAHLDVQDTIFTLYVFNWGNYGKVRKFLTFVDDIDYLDIEDFLCNKLRDYEIDAEANVLSHKLTYVSEIDQRFITVPDNELGNEVLVINGTLTYTTK